MTELLEPLDTYNEIRPVHKSLIDLMRVLRERHYVLPGDRIDQAVWRVSKLFYALEEQLTEEENALLEKE